MATPQRKFRADDETWSEIKKRAEELGLSASEHLRIAGARRPDVELPTRRWGAVAEKMATWLDRIHQRLRGAPPALDKDRENLKTVIDSLHALRYEMDESMTAQLRAWYDEDTDRAGVETSS